MKNIINNQTFLLQKPEKGEPLTTYMDFYKAKIQSDGSLDNLKLIIVVRGNIQKKELVRYTLSPTASMRTLKYFLSNAVNNKARVHQLYFIEAFVQAKPDNRVFVKLDSRYAYYFSEYSN